MSFVSHPSARNDRGTSATDADPPPPPTSAGGVHISREPATAGRTTSHRPTLPHRPWHLSRRLTHTAGPMSRRSVNRNPQRTVHSSQPPRLPVGGWPGTHHSLTSTACASPQRLPSLTRGPAVQARCRRTEHGRLRSDSRWQYVLVEFSTSAPWACRVLTESAADREARLMTRALCLTECTEPEGASLGF